MSDKPDTRWSAGQLAGLVVALLMVIGVLVWVADRVAVRDRGGGAQTQHR